MLLEPPEDVRREVPAVVERATQELGSKGLSAGAEQLGSVLLELTLPALVHVHGQVRSGGLPMADCDLAFEAVNGSTGREEDWDFTDRDGRYEVQLPAGRYRVFDDDEGSWTTSVLVPEGQPEFLLNIELPLGSR